MKAPAKWSTVVIAVSVLLFMVLYSDSYIQVNAITGATRTREIYGHLLSTTWKYHTTWIDASAKRQGLAIDSAWQSLSRKSQRGFVFYLACSRAPAAYKVSAIGTNAPPGMSQDQIDAFVREFAAAAETQRQAIAERLIYQYPE